VKCLVDPYNAKETLILMNEAELVASYIWSRGRGRQVGKGKAHDAVRGYDGQDT